MPIIGFNFEKILVERKNPIQKNVSVKNDIGIKDLTEQEVTIGNKKEKVLRFDYEFKVTYEPGIGEILMIGHILYTDEAKKQKELLNKWKKKQNVDDNLMQTLLNTVLFKCNIKALTLADELGLPPPIRLPKFKVKDKSTGYIG